MPGTRLWQLSAAELLAAYARRDLSPVEVVRDILERIERLNPSLHAFLAVNGEAAMAEARKAERVWRSPGEKPRLCGVPVSLKDTIEMAGLPTTYGSLAFKDNRQADSEIARRLRRAGAIILGKTNTPEFALGARVANRLGPPGANPWNLTHSCGGSSGGAGAAVAAGLGPIAIGTDSAGSIRTPAAFNGIFGLKPTFQRIPSVQVWRASPGRSHNGPLTRTVRDTALLMAALAGFHPDDPDSNLPDADYLGFAAGPLARVRIAVSLDFGQSVLTPPEAVRGAVEGAAALLREMGCDIVAADPPVLEGSDQMEPGVWAYSGDHYGAAEGMIPGFLEKHRDDLTDYARPVYEAGQRALAWHYRRILRRNRGYAARMRQWFEDWDFVLMPVAGPAPSLALSENQSAGARDPKAASFGYLAPFNHTHNPAASVPFGLDPAGLPIAVQVIGRHGDDVGVVRLAAAIEAARPWADRWPAGIEE